MRIAHPLRRPDVRKPAAQSPLALVLAAGFNRLSHEIIIVYFVSFLQLIYSFVYRSQPTNVVCQSPSNCIASSIVDVPVMMEVTAVRYGTLTEGSNQPTHRSGTL